MLGLLMFTGAIVLLVVLIAGAYYLTTHVKIDLKEDKNGD